MSVSPAANAISLKLFENINYSGAMIHQFSHVSSGTSPSTVSNTSSLMLQAASFLWEPWIATVNSNLTLSYINRQNDDDSNTGQNINGGINFNIFPQSHFPIQAFFNKSNSLVEGDLLEQDLTTTEFGFSQGYFTKAIRFNMNYRRILDEDDSTNTSFNNSATEDIEDALDLSLSTTLGDHDIEATSRFSFIQRDRPPVRNDQMLYVVRHNYRPGNNLTVNNLFTYSDRIIEQSPGAETDVTAVQFNSNAFWRPQSQKNLQVTVSTLLQGNGDTQESELGVFDSARLSAQASYQWNPFLNFRAQGNFSRSDESNRTAQQIGANYSPADRELFGFRHAYNLSVNGVNITEDSNPGRQQLTIHGGHFFSRHYPVAIGGISLTAAQRAATILDSEGKLDRTLTHTLGTGWNATTNNSTNVLSLRLSDTRRFSNDRDELGQQLANLQLSRNHQLNRYSSINGNITLQANRALNNNSGGSNTTFNSSVLLNYNHSQLFGVPRLRLRSEIRYLSDSLFVAINSDGLNDQDRNDIYWQNRLDYDIGRLSFRLSGNIGQSNGKFNNSLFLLVRRDFGR